MDTQKPPRFMPEVSGSTRLLSAFIDNLPVLCLSLVGFIVGAYGMYGYFSVNYSYNTISDASSLFESMKEFVFSVLITGTIGATYFICKDLFGGRSIGKRSQKLQVIRYKVDEPVSNIRLVVRNLFMFISMVEIIMYFANPRQRLGDMACDTTVVPATEANRQSYDGKKVALTIFVVFLCMGLFYFLYYQAVCLYFDFIIRTMNNSMMYQYH